MGGQSSVEYVALVALVAALLGAAATLGLPRLAPRPHPDAALTAQHAPVLVLERGTVGVPVDPRECRAVACSVGAEPVVFFHVVRGDGATYVQYWAYWPDSSWHGVAGRHADDWESFQVRVNADGTADARASAHHGYTGERVGPDLNLNQVRPDWVPERWRRGWTDFAGGWAVARHSHAGHLTSAAGGTPVRLVALDPAALPQAYAVKPPWRKEVYSDPESWAT
jgi:hypothetical protein